MAASKYDKYIVRLPREGRRGPGGMLMSNELVPGYNLFIMYFWITRKPEPNLIHESSETR